MERNDAALLEAWIEEHALAYLASGSAGRRTAPEDFVTCLASPSKNAEHARALLVERLHILLRLEGEVEAPHDNWIESGVNLPDFEVLELVGRGGMGQVFRAKQKSLSREVAIKVAMWPVAIDGQSRLRFLREAQAVAQLRHPGIVPLYQIGEHRGAPYLVLEFVRGRSLAAIVRDVKNGRLPRASASVHQSMGDYERATIKITIDILDAVGAAHDVGIVHRDLKPGNVLIQPDGRVRVLDFGLARLHGEGSITASHELIGTPDYMAPEIVRDGRAAGPWSDLYAVGVLAYEMLALEKPFERATSSATLARILSGEATPLHVLKRAPRRLSAIIEKAMAREIDRRYASAKSFVNDLRAYLEGQEIQAKPSTVLSRHGRRMQRNPALTAVGVMFLGALALLTSVWRGGSEVRAQMSRANATELTRTAFLWEYADGEPGGGKAKQSFGRAQAMENLEDALIENPRLEEARIELAHLCVAAGRPVRASELLTELETSGSPHRVVRWIRAWALDSERRGVHPDADEALVDSELSDIDRLALARSLLTRAPPYDSERAMEIVRPVENHPILGPVARYVQFEACNTRGRRDRPRASRYLQATLALLPDHPVALANFAMVLCESWTMDERKNDNTRADLTALVRRLADAERVHPRVRALWLNHASALMYLGQIGKARVVVNQALSYHPDDPKFINLLAQLCFDIWSSAMAAGGTLPYKEVEALRVQVERTIAHPEAESLNLVNLAKINWLLGDRVATVKWAERALSEALSKLSNEAQEKTRKELIALIEWAQEEPGPVQTSPSSEPR